MAAADFRLLIIPEEGLPYFHKLRLDFRSQAVKEGGYIINKGEAKVVIVYRNKKPTQLLAYRPQVYVHIERI